MKEQTILSTTHYDQFADITSNREVDGRHVRALVASIKQNNMLHLNPIIVTSGMEVIDGQHRLEAARELALSIYYVVDNKITKKDIAGLNSTQKNWSMLDYVNYYAVEKVPEFIILADMICRYPHIPITTILQLSNPSGSRNTRGFKEGKINVSFRDKACAIIAFIDQVRNLGIEHAYDRNFIMAIAEVWEVEGFKADQLLAKIEAYRSELLKCTKQRQYLQVIEDVYNYRMHNKVRLFGL